MKVAASSAQVRARIHATTEAEIGLAKLAMG
jgi:hypothetical protein